MVTTVTPNTAVKHDLEVVLELATGRLAPSSTVLELLQNLAATLGRGADVTLLAQDKELSPNDAAALIGVSRPHLLSFMDAGALAFTRVGTHRRIKVGDLLEFNERRQAARNLVAEARANSKAASARELDKLAPLSDEALAELDEL